jgi:hypothetical protein
MAVTKAIPPESLELYFAEFTQRFLKDGSPEAADVELLDPEMGDQVPVQGARLIGISFDPKKQFLELEFDVGDHRIMDPGDVWAQEEPDGFVNSVAVMHRNGSREVIIIKHVGLRRLY